MASRFISTFVAENGDSWRFEYDHDTGQGIVTGPDIDADERHKVIEGVAYDLVMDSEEKRWLLAAWEEATGRRSEFHDEISA